MALPPTAVTEVALSGISRYYNISGITLYVYNRDGASACGVMCAAWNLLDMLRATQQVDIFYTVRYIRLFRRQFIETMVKMLFLFTRHRI